MEQLNKKEPKQAVLMADNYNDNFVPITKTRNPSLLHLVNIPLIDYALESLNRCGVEEVYIFCSTFIDQVKEHVLHGIAKKYSWSIDMRVEIIGSEGCRCLGDALRDLYDKGRIRGDFILMGADTVTNAQLVTIMQQHKRNCRFDRGAAMTLIYKRTALGQRNKDNVVIAVDVDSNRLLFHQRVNPIVKEDKFLIPLDLFSTHTAVNIEHDLIDPQIAICSQSVLSLFADNFDFETRDDFIKGLLINEEILESTLYVYELPTEQYAGKVSNWQSYQLVARDLIRRWAYPLVPDLGISCLKPNYRSLRNGVYLHQDVQLAGSCRLIEDVVMDMNCMVDEKSLLTASVAGRGCRIGKNCRLDNAYLMENVEVKDNCELKYCVIGNGCVVENDGQIINGSVLGDGVVIPKGIIVDKSFVQSTIPEESCKEIGPKAFIIPENVRENGDGESDSDEEQELNRNKIVKMEKVTYNYTNSVYSSSSEDDTTRDTSPVQDDENIFLSEVIDSLNRGWEEKSNPDFLILEINSSRYAYNMSLAEVNFYVVKAILSVKPITEAGVNLIAVLNQVLSHLGPVLRNYIRGESAQGDCLKAIHDCYNHDAAIKSKITQIIHYFYDKEIISEDSILRWYGELNEVECEILKKSLGKLIEWLNQSSEEESDSDEN